MITTQAQPKTEQNKVTISPIKKQEQKKKKNPLEGLCGICKGNGDPYVAINHNDIYDL